MDPELLSLDRLPLPNLKVYTVLSFLAASSSIYFIWTQSDSAFQDGEVGPNFCGSKVDLSLSNELVSQLNSNKFNTPAVQKYESDGPAPVSSSSGFQVLSRFLTVSDYLWPAVGNEEDSKITRNMTAESDCVQGDYQQLTWQLLRWASQQPQCVWPFVNLAYCFLILFSHSIQLSVFGNLRTSEQENIKDQFWNLVFYKVVFVFGVVNVQEVEDAVGWCFFVSVIGFLQLARQLCKERHNYLMLMNDMNKTTERNRVLRLLLSIFIISISLFVGVIVWYMKSASKDFQRDFLDFKSIAPFMKPYEDTEPVEASSGSYDFNLGLHSAVFMLSEIGLLILQTFHALTMCVLDHLYFRRTTSKWNLITIFTNSELVDSEEEDLYSCISQDINYKFEIVSLMCDLIHHVHMLVCCNLFLSMTSLIVSLQMRMRVRQIHSVLKRRQSFTWLNDHIERYTDANFEEDEKNECDNCAICWESTSSQKSKILPCNHVFHKTCLRKWLLVSMHCPTCRMSLLSEKEAQLRREREPRRIYSPRPAVGIMGLLQTGQTLLDLFGGWDPLPDEYYNEGQSTPNNVPIFSDFRPDQVPVEDTAQEQPVLDLARGTRKD